MNELNNTLMSTAIGAEVTGYVLADVRGVNSMGECAEDTSKGAALLLYNKAPRPSYKAAEGFVCCLLVNILTAGVSALWQLRRGAVTLHSRGSSQR